MSSHNNNYFAAQYPTPFRVLGLRLKPFCLGHYTLLAHPIIDCAFVSENPATPTTADLIAGVFICSKTYEEGKQIIESTKWIKDVTRWGRSVGKYDPLEKVKLFKQYIDEGSAMPRYWDMQSDGEQSSGAHWVQAIKLCLTGKLGYTATEVMNIPLTQAFADYFKQAESDGLIQLMTPAEIALADSMEKEVA